MRTLTLTDANFDAFMDAFYEATPLWSVDLMAANPDIAEQVAFGGFDVTVTKVEFEGETVYVARGDDGYDGFDLQEFLACSELCGTEAEAREAANGIISQWKRNWNM